MPYATRQSSIDFPKRKSILRNKSQNVSDVIKRTPESKTTNVTTSSSARKAFHSSICGDIIGREKELKQLTDFLMTHLDTQTSGSMYISGLPGTGKTASINFIIEQNELQKKFVIVKINCTAFNSSKAVFKRICEELKLKTICKTEKEAIDSIEKYLLRKHKMILLILDEIDQLESKSQSVLYKIFEWPSRKNSKFVLVGIANAMDLTSRNLPRLCAKVELKPILMHFAPYTKDEIAEILKSRLTEVGADKIFAPGAIELISAKVAGTSGDLRRALDLGKRVIEIAEQKNQNETLDTPLKSQQNSEILEKISQKTLKRKIIESPSKRTSELKFLSDLESQVKSPQKQLCSSEASPCKLFRINESSESVSPKVKSQTPTKFNSLSNGSFENKVLRRSPRKFKSVGDIDQEDVENSPTKFQKKSPTKLAGDMFLPKSARKLQFDVDSRDVLNVVKTVFGSSKNFKPNEESSFPLHQKLLICTLLLIMKKGNKKDLNVGKLHQVYSKICGKRGLTAVDKSGFLFLCRQVEVTGVLQIGKGLGTLAKVTLQWDESEIANSLKDLNMLSSILNDTSCLT